MLIAYVVVFNLPFFIEDFMLHINEQLGIIEPFILFQEHETRRCLVNTFVAIGSYEYYVGFLKAAFVMVSLSNKCISLICLQHSKLTWQPNVPNASGVELFWD